MSMTKPRSGPAAISSEPVPGASSDSRILSRVLWVVVAVCSLPVFVFIVAVNMADTSEEAVACAYAAFMVGIPASVVMLICLVAIGAVSRATWSARRP